MLHFLLLPFLCPPQGFCVLVKETASCQMLWAGCGRELAEMGRLGVIYLLSVGSLPVNQMLVIDATNTRT